MRNDNTRFASDIVVKHPTTSVAVADEETLITPGDRITKFVARRHYAILVTRGLNHFNDKHATYMLTAYPKYIQNTT